MQSMTEDSKENTRKKVAEPILDRPRFYQEKPKWVEERTNFYNVKYATMLNQER
jgi:hypothetical protein